MTRSFRRSIWIASVIGLIGCRFDLDRSLDPGDIRGTLVLADDKGVRVPAAGALVSIENGPLVVRADDRGRFVLRNVPTGVYDISASWTAEARASGEPAGIRLRNIELTSAQQARDLGVIELGGLGAIEGKVLNPAGTDVQAIVDGLRLVGVEGGAFAFEKLAPGDYAVALVGDGGVWSGGEVRVDARKATSVEIDQAASAVTTGSLTGRVVVAGGGSAFGATVRLAGTTVDVDVDDDGRFALTGLQAGVYTLTARAPGTWTTHRPFVVVAGASVSPDLLLVPVDAGCSLGIDAATPSDLDGDGVPDTLEPDVCLCHPGHVDADADGACDDPEDDPTPSPECVSDEECTDDQVCQFGHCVIRDMPPECVSSEECADDEVCELGHCVESETPHGCASNLDCEFHTDGEFCLESNGRCVACLVDADCFRGICRPGNWCGPPPDCETNDDCASHPDGEFCLADEERCVECLDDADCPSGSCLGDNTCAPPVECATNDDCVWHANGPFCLDPEGVCVECLNDGDCSSGEYCNSTFVCESDDWSILLDGASGQYGRALVALGESVFLRLEGVPTDADVSIAQASPALMTLSDGGEFHVYELHADAIGTSMFDISVDRGGAVDVRTVSIMVVYDPSQVVFFDLEDGEDLDDGSLETPKKNPVAYLQAMTAATEKRHLYLTGGDVDLTDVNELTFDATQGPDRIIVTGGYFRTGADWYRDPGIHRTRFVQSQLVNESKFVVSGSTTDVILDGIVIDNAEGIQCKNGATLRVLNSQVTAQKKSALETTDCQGLVAGSVLLPGSYESLDATVKLGAPFSGKPSTFRLIHNLVLSKAGNPFMRSGLLGGDIRFNVFHRVGNPITIDSTFEFDGNFFGSMAQENPSDFDMDWLNALNGAALPQASNERKNCALVTDFGSLNALYEDGLFDIDAACSVIAPLPEMDDVVDTYAIRHDRSGQRRYDGKRSPGPLEADEWFGPRLTLTVPSPVELVVGERRAVTVTASQSNVSWTATGMGMDLTEGPPASGSTGGAWTFNVRADMAGSAGLRLTAMNMETFETASVVVRLEVRPKGNLRFVDFNAASNGDGTEFNPFNAWPTSPAANTSILVAEASTSAGAKLSAGWLPEGVRVYGGYARDADGRFVRRLPLVETNLKSSTANTSVVVQAGSAVASPTARVIDGVTFTSPGSTVPALVVEGPLLLVRSRVIASHSGARAVLEVGGQGANVAVVGSTIVYRPNPSSTSAIDLVRFLSGAAPSFFFNDLYRGYRMSGTVVGSAFRAFENTLGGSFAGNRYWGENLGVGEYVFFDAQLPSTFEPSAVEKNAIMPDEAPMGASVAPTNIGDGTWGAISSTSNVGNLMSADCVSSWPFGRSWAPQAPNCQAAISLPSVYLGIDESVEGVGVDFDHLGHRISTTDATIGATQSF